MTCTVPLRPATESAQRGDGGAAAAALGAEEATPSLDAQHAPRCFAAESTAAEDMSPGWSSAAVAVGVRWTLTSVRCFRRQALCLPRLSAGRHPYRYDSVDRLACGAKLSGWRARFAKAIDLGTCQ